MLWAGDGGRETGRPAESSGGGDTAGYVRANTPTQAAAHEDAGEVGWFSHTLSPRWLKLLELTANITPATLLTANIDDHRSGKRNSSALYPLCANTSLPASALSLSHLAKPEELGGWGVFFCFFYVIFCFLSMAPRQGQARFNGAVN